VKIDEAALYAIARGADGGMRDAESTLDQLISFCGDKIEEPDVLSMFGLAAESQILKLSKAVLGGEIQTALTELNELSQSGKDLGRLLSDLLNHFRNLLIYQVSRGDLNLLEVSEAEVAALKEQAALASTDAFTRILEVFADTELRLRDAASKKIMVEVALLRAIEARNALPIDAVLRQLNQLRGGQSSAGVSPAQSPAAERRPLARHEPEASRRHAGPETGAPIPAAADIPADLAGMWTKLVEAISRVSPFIRTYLLEAAPVSFEKNTLVIGFDPEFSDHLALIDNPRNHTLLQTKLAEVGHPNAQIKFIKAELPADRVRVISPAPAAPAAVDAPPATPTKEKSAPVAFNKNDFKNDPLIQKALEIFKGQIVEVRA
jgi:DNA polymerase-3 subunit gamma/tau